MSSSFDFDRQITAWLDEQAPMHEPEDLAEVALARTRRTRQLPGWATLERWVPMETRYRFGAVPRTGLILVILATLLALFSAIAVGQQPSPKLPPPLGVARNGLIAFDDGGDIYVVNPDGTGRKALTSGPEWETNPVWSQDGTQIAYWSQPDSKQQSTAALKVMDADGGNVRALATDLTRSPWSTDVAWSRDGRSLAYSDVAGRPGLEVDRIMVVPVAGGDPVEVVSPGQDPTWSPDDTLIGYRGGGLTRDVTNEPVALMVVAADGTNKRSIDKSYTDNPYAFERPQWSPDGQWLAYHGGLNGAADIRVAAVDGSSVKALDHGAVAGVWPVWSLDGTRLAYESPSSTVGYQVTLIDADGSHVTVLKHPPLGCNCGVGWSPDGTRLTAYQDGPVVGHEDTGGATLIIDPTGTVPPLAIPFSGLSNQSVSWQRLAP